MNALVMYDHQTRTLWSQFLGKGVKGTLAGVELDFLPVTQTQWSLWSEAHPDTLALNKGGRYRFDTYDSYYREGSAEVLGETRSDDRMDRKALVVGGILGGSTKAYPLDLLSDMPMVNDSLGGGEVLVYLESDTDTALVYDREVDGRVLIFSMAEDGQGAFAVLVDAETGSGWLALTGKATDGPLEGRVLNRALSHLSFWFAWKDWNPDTEVY